MPRRYYYNRCDKLLFSPFRYSCGGYKERLHLGIHFLRFEAQNDAVKCIKVEIAFY